MTVHLVLIATIILGAALWLARLRQHRALAAGDQQLAKRCDAPMALM